MKKIPFLDENVEKGNIITFCGIWMYPPLAAVFLAFVAAIRTDWNVSDALGYALAFLVPLLLPITMLWTNVERYNRGQRDFSLKATLGLSEKNEKLSQAYLKAAYPAAPAKYTSKIPQGLIVGKQKNQYVYCPIKSDGVNSIIVGAPGSGKSILLLSWIYSMLYRDEVEKAGGCKSACDKPNFALVDIKGELFEKILHIKSKDYAAEEHKNFQVVMPSNRRSYGWDVFYAVHKDGVTETEIIKMVNDLATALVLPSGDNPYFTDNARKILSGFLYFAIMKKWGFIQAIQKLTRSDFGSLLTEIVDEATECGYGVCLDKLKSFVGKEDNESLQDIESTLKSYLDVFSYPDIQYCFSDNPCKTSPAILDDGVTCLDLAIEESMLEVYRPIFRLITMQILRHAEGQFHEDDTRRTLLIFDEAARIGAIDGLDAAMSTLRSKHTSLICLFQSISQFKDIYPEQKANTLLNLCELKLFLSGAGDKDTSDYVSAMAGEYKSSSMSYKTKGALGGKSDGSYSETMRPIVDTKSLMELREKNEAIGFIYGTYVRVKKMKYFEDPLLTPIINRHKDQK